MEIIAYIFYLCCSYSIVLFEIEKHTDYFYGFNHLTIICIRCELSRLDLAKIFIVYNGKKKKKSKQRMKKNNNNKYTIATITTTTQDKTKKDERTTDKIIIREKYNSEKKKQQHHRARFIT